MFGECKSARRDLIPDVTLPANIVIFRGWRRHGSGADCLPVRRGQMHCDRGAQCGCDVRGYKGREGGHAIRKATTPTIHVNKTGEPILVSLDRLWRCLSAGGTGHPTAVKQLTIVALSAIIKMKRGSWSSILPAGLRWATGQFIAYSNLTTWGVTINHYIRMSK